MYTKVRTYTRVRRRTPEWGDVHQGEETCTRVRKRTTEWGDVHQSEETYTRVRRRSPEWGDVHQSPDWGDVHQIEETYTQRRRRWLSRKDSSTFTVTWQRRFMRWTDVVRNRSQENSLKIETIPKATRPPMKFESVFPLTNRCYPLILTASITSASSERSLSKLKLIKIVMHSVNWWIRPGLRISWL
jgi:hypothetical protein